MSKHIVREAEPFFPDRLYDESVDILLAKLNDDDLELIGDSLLASLNGDCDEFFHRLFEKLIPTRIMEDKSDKWRAVCDFIRLKLS